MKHHIVQVIRDGGDCGHSYCTGHTDVYLECSDDGWSRFNGTATDAIIHILEAENIATFKKGAK